MIDGSAAGASIVMERHDLPGDGNSAVVITLNRPEQLNALDWEMLRLLDSTLDDVERDVSVRTVLVTGRGRAFSAGGDLKKYIELQRDPVQFPAFVADLHRIFGRLRQLRVPVVALVNGLTAAGGLELLLSCDFALAARSARIGDGHLNFGQMGGGGVLTLLPRLIGLQRASELIFSGALLSAEEAVGLGIVSRVVDDAALLNAGLEFAAAVAVKSPLAVANAKQVMNDIWSDALPLSAGLRLERERNAYYCLTSEDAPEGLTAFSEKRPPRFTGR
ncbi:MAG TPA: enoyl-CoA hydratase/isomerase family protein [Candidatus Dormibacteraeota bacterium]|jgi:enoyl-CoA hydratase|nr:enoyl-CoA hydratase/isomerase family protein [Candidatus Dormibacteraeota bacterium]